MKKPETSPINPEEALKGYQIKPPSEALRQQILRRGREAWTTQEPDFDWFVCFRPLIPWAATCILLLFVSSWQTDQITMMRHLSKTTKTVEQGYENDIVALACEASLIQQSYFSNYCPIRVRSSVELDLNSYYLFKNINPENL